MRRWVVLACAAVWALAGAAPAWGHIGQKDVFEQVQAGPYRLYVTVRTPVVIPGVATVEVRSSGAPVRTIELTPVPLTGEAAKHPPAADAMEVSAGDPGFFTGSLWLMASGSWQVRLKVEGAGGTFEAGVPVAAAPLQVLRMQRPLGILLAVLGVVLVLGMAGIVAAAVREARLAPGVQATPERRRRAAVASVATLVVLAAAVWLGNKWWKVDAASYAKDVYRPADLHAQLTGDRLTVEAGRYDEDTKRWEPIAPATLLLDHEHLMHLYAIRWPEMDAAFHLHPAPVAGSPDVLAMELPAMPAGEYRLFADIVHRSGFPETLTAEITVPAGLKGGTAAEDDASVLTTPVAAGELGTSCKLPDGYTMVWDRPAEIVAGTGYTFRFRLLDRAGQPAGDVQPYLGMAGHAAWVKVDGTTFAHTHPEGSAAMQAVMLAGGGPGQDAAMDDMPGMEGMAGMGHGAPAVGPVVEFPYGFPAAGRYRVFVQMKHSGVVETGVFDAEVR